MLLNPVIFDVRALLATGVDPFEAIQKKWSELPEGQSLAICAPFEPRPLLAHFSGIGVPVSPGAIRPGECWVLIGPKPC